MKPFITMILALVGACNMAVAGAKPSARVDSLSRLLPTLTGDAKLRVYEELVLEQEWSADTKPVLAICNAWIEEARLHGNVENEEKARSRKLTLIYNTEDWDLLVTEGTAQRQWMEQHERWDGFYKAWRDIIEAHSYDKKPQTALREAEQMKDHAQRMDNSLGMALAYQQMGVIYDNIDHAQAAKAFERSIELLKKTPGAEGSELLSAYYYMAQELDQLGSYAYELRICAEWMEALKTAEYKENTTDSRRNVHHLECRLWTASALIGLNQLDEADRELSICTELNKDLDDPYLNYEIQVHRAHLALRQGNTAEAERWSDQFVSMMDTDQWPLALRLRGDILMQAGRYADAARHYRHIYQQKDSMFSKDVRLHLDEFNTLFKLDELQMQGQLERSRFIIFIVTLVLVALLIIMYLRHRAAKRLEQKNRELTIANERANESSKMKTNFIQQISHEIRTPLNILSGFTQILTTPGVELGEAERADINQRITENTDRITNLVNKMLELSSANSQTVIERNDQVSPAQVAAQAVQESRAELAQHVAFRLTLGDGAEATQLLTNLEQATRALTLLLDNALKFTKEGSVDLTVTTADSPTRQALFTVTDTGIGVPAGEAERIFDEFVQLDEYYDGTGIGLTVARSLARRMGGDIRLDTTYTGGARFVLSLPLS